MAHRLSLEAKAELDEIWYYIAKDSGSIRIVYWLIDSINDLLANQAVLQC